MFTDGRAEYTQQIINVTFLYSDKEYNLARKNLYVKSRTDYYAMDLINHSCVQDGVLLAIEVDKELDDEPLNNDLLSPYFAYDEEKNCYVVAKQPETTMSKTELRKWIYENGFVCDGIKYVRFKRTAGAARIGKCLFINEQLYNDFHKWEDMGVNATEGKPIDLAAYETYKSLSGSSIIDTIKINPESILIIDDYDSVFHEDCVRVYNTNGELKAEEANCKIKNSIWDGQSLLDESVFQSSKYKNKSMLLLRERMAKTAAFRCDIQKWFKDNNITDIKQLNGITLADSISKIKMITTPNSIKFCKFGSGLDWLKRIDGNFGIVKYEKKTHYFEGEIVRVHYQLLNTLQLSKEQVYDLLQDSFNFAQLLKDKPSVVRYFINFPYKTNIEQMNNNNEVIYNLLSVNNKFCKTTLYKDFLKDILRSYYSNLRRGHIFVKGNYSTLLGNPIEMLQASIGKFNGESIIGKQNIYCKNFQFDIDLLASRSPHVCFGNIFIGHNKDNSLITKYLPNLTNEIVVVNSIGENLLNRLSGADFDSDTVLLTNNNTLIKAAKKNYDIFKVPVNEIEASKISRVYSTDEMADLDNKTCENKIGEIVNFSQILNTLYWDKIGSGKKVSDEEMKDLYNDIVLLDILSGTEIDSAKKEFDISSSRELKKLRKKYKKYLFDKDEEKDVIPYFFEHISKLKGYYNPQRKKYLKHSSTMDFVSEIVKNFKVKNTDTSNLTFASVVNDEYIDVSKVNYTKINQCIDTAVYMLLKDKNNLSGFQEEINNINISKTSMLYLLQQFDLIKSFPTKILILRGFFSSLPDVFEKCIAEARDNIYSIEKNSSGEIDIFGIKYSEILQK